LASNYGFTEHFILWELPYTRALKYLHAALWANGAWTVKAKVPVKEEYNLLFSIANQPVQDDDDV
jgi:hypothetical protein